MYLILEHKRLRKKNKGQRDDASSRSKRPSTHFALHWDITFAYHLHKHIDTAHPLLPQLPTTSHNAPLLPHLPCPPPHPSTKRTATTTTTTTITAIATNMGLNTPSSDTHRGLPSRAPNMVPLRYCATAGSTHRFRTLVFNLRVSSFRG